MLNIQVGRKLICNKRISLSELAKNSDLKIQGYSNSNKCHKSFLLLEGEIIEKKIIISYRKIIFVKTHYHMSFMHHLFPTFKKNLSEKGSTSHFHPSSFRVHEMAKVHFCLL